MEEHPLVGRQPTARRLVVVVEDGLVDFTGLGVLGWVLVLGLTENEEGVGVARGLDEKAVEDFTGMVAPGEEEDDGSAGRLEDDACGVDGERRGMVDAVQLDRP